MAWISVQEVSLGFGGPLLFDRINLQIERGERIGLLGRNGMGKSTLLKLIYGTVLPEDGVVSRQQNLRIAYLPQEVNPGFAGSVRQIVAGGLEDFPPIPQPQGWAEQGQVDKVLSRMQLDGSAQFGSLSAGMKRRVLLARGLARDPQLLLLDEPTNHLDIDSIRWLEDLLMRWEGTVVFVTHDRSFLQRLANRIVELDRGRLFDWNSDYATFLRRKESILSAEQAVNATFDKELAQEEQWIRKGIEARRTRNEGRVRALLRLRQLRDERRDQPGKVRLQIQEARRSGNLVIEAQHLTYRYDQRAIVQDFSTLVRRGDKVGVIGPNGAGKTTLINLLIGKLASQSGAVELGTHLEIAYFDQLRTQLNENQTIYENVGQGRDAITIGGKTRNLVGYLEDFLFERERIHAPISVLSGGERNRLLLARLFSLPANLLVLDEPTNDLDIETIELLEDLLMEYSGTLLLVSHDRTFLNNLVTSTIAMDGQGQAREFVGGYDDWLRQAQADEKPEQTARKTSEAKPVPMDDLSRKPATKLSYKEQRALEADRQSLAELPDQIAALEADQERLNAAMAAPAFYQQAPAEIATTIQRLHDLQEQVTQAYQRWEELEQRLGSS